MKLSFFHMQGYRDLPDDFSDRYASVWVNPPNDELCDPVTVGKYLRMNLKELLYAAELGYDGIGTNEHHQNAYGFPMPSLTAYHLAAATEDVAIVLLGVTLPMNHPLRVAEEMAQIDALSGGRLIAGWPVGTTMDVNHCYGVTPSETRPRFMEAHDLIKAAWTRPGPFIWNGKYYKLRHVNPWPKPIQQPHPPIWLAGGGSMETWELAVKHNYVYPFLSFNGHLAGQMIMQQFWDCNAAAGNDHNPYRAGFAQIVVVAETDQEAERLYSRHIMNFYKKTLHIPPYFSGTPGYSSKRSMVNAMNKFQEPTAFSQVPTVVDWKEAIESGKVIGGSPATVRQRLEEAAKTLNIGNFILLMQLQSMPHELTMYNLRMFAEKVMPHIKDLWDDKWSSAGYWPSGARRPKVAGVAPAELTGVAS
jgi:alkanesulfonate monooxygenase SsuD/methylene tetrahydromethanopterin reductase-like flavin-dependent oxidoreductase (luciferase family)